MSTEVRPYSEVFASERWSAVDEAKFQDMQARRTTVITRRRVKLHQAVHGVPGGNTDLVVDYLIEHANAIRDALEPYDSGVRPA